MCKIFFLFMFCCLFWYNVQSNDARHVVYPPGFGNKVQFIVGIGVPASNLPTVQSVSWGYVIKTNYVLPTNVTEYGESLKYMKRSAGISRWDFYQLIVEAINRAGLNGEECLKRSICETAKVKFSTQLLFGELIHLLLLPSSSKDTDTDYYRAELLGEYHGTNCARLYKRCPVNLVDLFSIIKLESHFPSLLGMYLNKYNTPQVNWRTFSKKPFSKYMVHRRAKSNSGSLLKFIRDLSRLS